MHMVALYYEVLFVVSFLLSILYVFIWRKHFDVNITAIFFLVPITNYGFYMFSKAYDDITYLYSQKIAYIGGCYLIFFVTVSVFNLCEIPFNKWIRFGCFIINSVLYASVLSVGKYKNFYKSFSFRVTDDGIKIVKEYGYMHTIFTVVVVIYLTVGIGAILYSIVKKKQVSNTILYLLMLPEVLCVFGFYGSKLFGRSLEIMPLVYVFAQFVYILIVRRMSHYNVSDTVIESMVQRGETGFVSIDFKYRFLGANETAKEILPELRELVVDHKITDVKGLDSTLTHWVKHFEEDQRKTRHLYIVKKTDDPENVDAIYKTDTLEKTDASNVAENNHDSDKIENPDISVADRAYIINTNYLYDGRQKIGYQVFIQDDTQNQKYIALMDKYNSELEEEVEKKTQNIVNMHNNLILSMATMVESRDNSTGGHIKRTSVGVRILIEEMKKNPDFGFSEKFCNDIIKAAPMHDLGKVAVDDVILRKPGRFTPEEFEIMKTHAAEGARIVHEILKDTEDEEFRLLAENMAHYHHERMDGSGYPEGLKGEEIPMEARIMAIADVYDALVSKRVYKEAMSFEEADKIIMEGMGKHFDPELKKYYESARPRLEAYYKSLEE